MSGDAWPFLIGRAEHAGYRTVAAPDFLTGARELGALTRASATVDLPEGAASARELRGLAGGPLTIVYRSFHPRGSDFGIPGEEMLTDRVGRPIRITEGLVLRHSLEEAGRPKVTRADLDRAHARVADAYRDFWQQGDAYQRRAVGAQRLGEDPSDGSPLHLVAAAPWDVDPSSTATPREHAAAWGSTTTGPSAALSSPAPLSSQPSASGARLVKTAAAAVGAGIVILLAISVLGHKNGGKSPPPAATAAATQASTTQSAPAAMLAKFCSALTGGQTATAAGFTSAQLHEVRALDPKPTTCAPTIRSMTPTSALGILAVGPNPPVTWNITLAADKHGTWTITALTQSSASAGATPPSRSPSR